MVFKPANRVDGVTKTTLLLFASKNMSVSDFGSPYVYTFETANYIDLYSGLGYPQTSGTPDQHDDDGDDWVYENNSDMVVSGKGYAVLKSGNSGDHIINFMGAPHNGFISVPVFLSGDNSLYREYNSLFFL